jgi:hypothetical protein
MPEPAVRLEAVSEAADEMRGIAGQALEWVRVSEERVAEAEARAERVQADAERRVERVQAELKQRAMETLKKLGEEGRERIAAERSQRKAVEGRVAAAEQARDRAEQAFEKERRTDRADREALAAEMIALKERSEEERLELLKHQEAESEKRLAEAIAEVREGADSRVASAEQRAAEAEAAEEEARSIAVKIEAEIEERVMQGTADVRREAEERVRALVEKFEGEAEELARNRAKDQLQAESDRIRKQAQQREERARRTAEEEIKASTSRARREAIAAADETAPSWSPPTPDEAPVSGYRTF